jgi:CubicO group peptidase (beta-lactamase class C family)
MRGWVAALALAAAPLAAQGPDQATIARRVDSLVVARQAALGLPGVAVAVVHPLGTVHETAAGEARAGVPMTVQTPILIGSVGKPFTATLVMQQVDAGRLVLDSAVQQYLPWFRVADSVHSATITVRQLLQHRSGIPTSAGLRRLGESSLDSAVASLRDVRTEAPGSAFAYSNANYHVLGALLRAVTGTPYPDLVQSRLFRPLRMAQSATDTAGVALATGHRLWFGLPRAAAPSFNAALLPAGDLVSTAQDLGRFVRMTLGMGTLDGVGVLSLDGAIEMSAFDSGGTYALGWGWRRVDTLPALGHSGALDVYQTELILVPGAPIGVALVTTTTGMFTQTAIRRLALDVTRVALGLDPLPDPAWSPTLIWRLLLLGALALVFTWGRQLWRLPRWRDELRTARRATGQPYPRKQLVSAIWDLAMAAVVPLGIAAFAGITLPALLVIQTDLGLLVVVGMVVSAVLGVTKNLWLVTGDKGQGTRDRHPERSEGSR